MAKDYEIKLSEVEGLTPEDVESLKELGVIHTTWRDYTLMMLNSTAEPLRSIWREKVCTSVTHWSFNKGSISEGNIFGVEVLTSLPDELTNKVCDDIFHFGSWKKLGRLSGSKRMNIFLGHYPQESLSNEAALCLKYIINHWNESIEDMSLDGSLIPEYNINKIKTYGDIVKYTPILNKMYKLANMTDGKCIMPDEVLTYILERPVDDSRYGVWMDVAVDIFSNGIPSEKYKKYWRTSKIDNFPLNCVSEEVNNRCIETLSCAVFDPSSSEYDKEMKYEAIDSFFDEYIVNFGDGENSNNESDCQRSGEENNISRSEESNKKEKENFLSMVQVILKEDVSYSPCYKKIAICILKNDVSMKYAGFGSTYKERLAREEALAAFSSKQSEKESAKANALALAKKIEKENREKGKIEL